MRSEPGVEAAAYQGGRPTRADLGITGLILGVAATAWFGWGQAQPPSGWGSVLSVGSVLAIMTTVAAGGVMWRARGEAPSMNDPRVRAQYWRVLGLYAAAIAIGVAVLAAVSQSAYIAAWVLFLVGIHFVPLGRLFGIAELIIAGGLLMVAGVAAAVSGAATVVRPSAVAGAAGGLVCLVVAVSVIVRTSRSGLRTVRTGPQQ